ncbi:unnamed protein product [Ilex paraguariensis]|uniref:Uncharacterized protein n=1 Tax=Ilex paraguariensis TaxID=185542 RepID=A0ABC8SML0_9AQUA
MERMELPTTILIGKMNVGFAWSHAPKWSCLVAVMRCASTAIVIGTHDQSPAHFVEVA